MMLEGREGRRVQQFEIVTMINRLGIVYLGLRATIRTRFKALDRCALLSLSPANATTTLCRFCRAERQKERGITHFRMTHGGVTFFASFPLNGKQSHLPRSLFPRENGKSEKSKILSVRSFVRSVFEDLRTFCKKV